MISNDKRSFLCDGLCGRASRMYKDNGEKFWWANRLYIKPPKWYSITVVRNGERRIEVLCRECYDAATRRGQEVPIPEVLAAPDLSTDLTWLGSSPEVSADWVDVSPELIDLVNRANEEPEIVTTRSTATISASETTDRTVLGSISSTPILSTPNHWTGTVTISFDGTTFTTRSNWAADDWTWPS